MEKNTQTDKKLTHNIKTWIDLASAEIQKRKPDRFEVYVENRKGLQVDIKDQLVDSFLRSEDQGLNIRVLKDNKLGHCFCTQLSKQSIEKAIQSAFEIMEILPEDQNHDLFNFGEVAYPEVNQWSQKSIDTPIEEKIQKAITLEKECKKTDPRITALRAASLRENTTNVFLSDSNGNLIQHKATRFTLSAMCKSEENGETQTGYDYDFSWDLNDLDPKKIGIEAANDALKLLGAQIPQSTQCPVVFPSRIMGDLLDFLTPSFSQENIEKRKSMLMKHFGQKVFSDAVTLIDDGLYPNGLGSTPFDGEGVPKKKLVLIEKGVFTETHRDLYQAKKTGKPSTASTHRSIQSKPSVGASNLYIEPGQKSFEDLVKTMNRGAIITNLMGIHTANGITGQFSLGATGHWVENGKIAYPIREFAVAGNMLELFSKIAEVGSDLRFYGTTGSPAVLVSELSIGGK